jgi:hypothetical protein
VTLKLNCGGSGEKKYEEVNKGKRKTNKEKEKQRKRTKFYCALSHGFSNQASDSKRDGGC